MGLVAKGDGPVILTGTVDLPDGGEVQLLVTIWPDGSAEAATRQQDWERWGPPASLSRESEE